MPAIFPRTLQRARPWRQPGFRATSASKSTVSLSLASGAGRSWPVVLLAIGHVNRKVRDALPRRRSAPLQMVGFSIRTQSPRRIVALPIQLDRLCRDFLHFPALAARVGLIHLIL